MLLNKTFISLSLSATGARGAPTTEGDNGPAENADGVVWKRVGHHPQVHLFSILPPGRQNKGSNECTCCGINSVVDFPRSGIQVNKVVDFTTSTIQVNKVVDFTGSKSKVVDFPRSRMQVNKVIDFTRCRIQVNKVVDFTGSRIQVNKVVDFTGSKSKW